MLLGRAAEKGNQLDAVSVLPVIHYREGLDNPHIQLQFLLQFPVQGLFRQFTVFQLPTGKLPHQGKGPLGITPGGKNLFAMENQAAYHLQWRNIMHLTLRFKEDFPLHGQPLNAESFLPIRHSAYIRGGMKWIPLIAVVVVFPYIALVRVKGADPGEAAKLLEAGALFVDVRTPGEFAEKSVPGSVNYPLDLVEGHISSVEIKKDEPILLFCRSGRRSGIAAEKLKAMGYTNVTNVGSFENARRVAEAAKAGGDSKE